MHSQKQIFYPTIGDCALMHMSSIPANEAKMLQDRITAEFNAKFDDSVKWFLTAHNFSQNNEGVWEKKEEDGGLLFVAEFHRTYDWIWVSAQVKSHCHCENDYAEWPTEFRGIWQRLVADMWNVPPSPESFITMERLELIMQEAGYYSPSELLDGVKIKVTLKEDSVDDILVHKGMEAIQEGEWSNSGSPDADSYVAVIHNDGNMEGEGDIYTVRPITCDRAALMKAQELVKLLRQFERK